MANRTLKSTQGNNEIEFIIMEIVLQHYPLFYLLVRLHTMAQIQNSLSINTHKSFLLLP